MVHSAGETLVLQPGYVWLQPASCPKVQDSSSAHQGICGESSSPHSGKLDAVPAMGNIVEEGIEYPIQRLIWPVGKGRERLISLTLCEQCNV